ncbi:hypothetical protein ZWY2020_019567 [Hordeum vulgare]|nr:hypothetical protein ZWY2020_019567 [Hordeum vulgare]
MWRKAKRAMGIGICAHLLAVTGRSGSEAPWRHAFSEDSAGGAAADAVRLIRRHNVPAGTHLIEVSSLGYFFSPVRVDISARNPGHIQAALTENRKVLNKLVLEPLKEEQYYEMREPFNILSLLKSPMGMMVGFMVVMVFVMPKMMENIGT